MFYVFKGETLYLYLGDQHNCNMRARGGKVAEITSDCWIFWELMFIFDVCGLVVFLEQDWG